MELSEALGIVSQVKNRYQAFQKLEDALRVASQLEGEQSDRVARVEGLKEEEASLRSRIADLQPKVDALAERLGTLQAETAKKLAAIELDLANEKAERVKAMEDEIEQRRAEAEADFTAQQNMRGAELAALQNSISIANQELDTVGAALKDKQIELAQLHETIRKMLPGGSA